MYTFINYNDIQQFELAKSILSHNDCSEVLINEEIRMIYESYYRYLCLNEW